MIDADLPPSHIAERPAIVRTADEMGVGLESKVNSFLLAKNISNAVNNKPISEQGIKEEKNSLESTILIEARRPYAYFFGTDSSPDGTNIIFVGYKVIGESAMEILMADSDGTNVRPLVRNSWNARPFWIDNENIGFYRFHEDNKYKDRFPPNMIPGIEHAYNVSTSGGKVFRLKTKYPAEDILIGVALSYLDGIEIAVGDKMVREDDKLIKKQVAYIDGKLNETISNLKWFGIAPSGDRIVYSEDGFWHIQSIKPINQVKSIELVGEPVIIKGRLLGFIREGEYKSNILMNYGGNIVMLDKDGKKISTRCKFNMLDVLGYGSEYTLDPGGESIIFTPNMGGSIYILRLNLK